MRRVVRAHIRAMQRLYSRYVGSLKLSFMLVDAYEAAGCGDIETATDLICEAARLAAGSPDSRVESMMATSQRKSA
jgi:hypothetical protein